MRSQVPFEEGLLAAGIVLTSASSLRFFGGVLGVGELVLGAWLVHISMSQNHKALKVELGARRRRSRLETFWIVVLATMLVGFLARIAWDVDSLRCGRDALAYVFVALITIGMCRRYDSRGITRIAGSVVRWMGLLVGIQVLAAIVLGGGPASWWYGPRFRGFSQDPNQMGFYVLALPFLAAWMQGRARGGAGTRSVSSRFGLAGLLVVCACVVVMTQSDSLLVAWLAGVLAMYVRYYVGSLARPVRGYWSGVLNLFIVPAVVVALVVANSSAVLGAVTQSLDEMVTKDNQAATRIGLWESAIEVVCDSPLVGWGPGSYAGPLGPYGEFEAHNSYLQLATNSGMIGLVAFLVLLLSVSTAAWKSGSPPLVGATAAVVVLMLFHHALRHPVLWFTLYAVAAMASSSVLLGPAQHGQENGG